MAYDILYSNTCEGANQNPFDPTNWTATSGGMPPSLAIASEQLVGGNSGGFLFGKNYYSGAEDLTSDCFCQFQIATIPPKGGSTNSDITFSVRSVAGGNYTSGYYAALGANGPSLFVTNPSGDTIIFSSLSKVSVGDVFILQAVGSLITIYQNGTSIGSATDSTTDRDGTVYLEIQWTAAQSDTGIVNLAIGSVVTTYSVSGNAGVAGATISYSGTSSGSTTTDGAGNFNLSLANGSYTITPSLTGYTFSPTSQIVTVSGSNITGVNFSATATGIGPSAAITPAYVPRRIQIFGIISSGPNAGAVCAVACDSNGNLAVSGGSGGAINSIDVLDLPSDAVPAMIYGAIPVAAPDLTVPGSTALFAVAVDQFGNILASEGTGGGNPSSAIDTPTACDTGVTAVQIFARAPNGNVIAVPVSFAGALGNTLNPVTTVPVTQIDQAQVKVSPLPFPVLLCGRIAPGLPNAGAIVGVQLDATGALCVSGSSGASTAPNQVTTFDNGECALVQLYGRNPSAQMISVPLTSAGSLYLN